MSEYTEMEQLAAIKRVLQMVDGYLVKQNQDALTTDGKGLMTWGEIRHHIQAALELPLLKKAEA